MLRPQLVLLQINSPVQQELGGSDRLIADTGISIPISTIVSNLVSISLGLLACPVDRLPSCPVFSAFIWTPYVPIMQKYNICT